MKIEHASYYDYVIVGTGVAGFQLALAIQADTFFLKKKIALIDPNPKNVDDKTFCFWEKDSGIWDSIVSNTWQSTQFYDSKHTLHKDLDPYTYKKINSIDFYNYCKTKLSKDARFSFIQEEVFSVTEIEEKAEIKTENQKVVSEFVFDSRIPELFSTEKTKYIYTPQTCYGWEIKTEKPIFDPKSFVMMDYRFQWEDSTTFTYILPKSDTEALVEFTSFTNYNFTVEEFEDHLKTYLNSFFPGVSYKITSKEDGRNPIPMTNYSFGKNNTKKVIKIGTAGGWVKSTSGYSFKRSEKFVKLIILQLKTGKYPSGYKQPFRFYFYDKLLLYVLQHDNKEGARIFLKMFSIPKISLLFQFLDEETNIWEEIKLMIRLPFKPFVKAIFSIK